MLKVDIIGDAKVLVNLLSDLRDAADKSMEDSMKYLGHTIQKEARIAMISNSYGWSALSDRWLKYKKKKGYHRKIYFMTKSLYTSLGQEVNKVNGSHQLKVGFPRTPHPVSRRPLSSIAKDLEYGKSSRSLPARPLLSLAAPAGQAKFLTSKYTPDILFKIKMEKLVAKASSQVTFSQHIK